MLKLDKHCEDAMFELARVRVQQLEVCALLLYHDRTQEVQGILLSAIPHAVCKFLIHFTSSACVSDDSVLNPVLVFPHTCTAPKICSHSLVLSVSGQVARKSSHPKLYDARN